MKGYIIRFDSSKRLALGDPNSGIELKGPILFVPQKLAIFFATSVQGDEDGMELVTIGVDYFESRDLFLKQIARQIKGEELIGNYKGSRFDLSPGLLEVDVSERDVGRLARRSKSAYERLQDTKTKAYRLFLDLEEKLGGHGVYDAWTKS